jgi:hypothetical protein
MLTVRRHYAGRRLSADYPVRLRRTGALGRVSVVHGMTSRATDLRFAAYGICALLTAACGDAIVEATNNAVLAGAVAVDHDQQGLSPMLAVAALSLLAFGVAIARRRATARRGPDWLAALAREVAHCAFRVHLAYVVGAALALVFVSESYERAGGGGAPFDGGDAPFAAIAAGFAVYLVCAMLSTVALSALMRAFAKTCDAVADFFAAPAAFVARVPAAKPARRARERDARLLACGATPRAVFGDRAPPQAA